MTNAENQAGETKTAVRNRNTGRTIAIIISAVFILAVIIVVDVLFNSRSAIDSYTKAVYCIENEEYADALATLETLEATEGLTERVMACYYEIGLWLLDNGDHSQALAIFNKLGEYNDSIAMSNQCSYIIATDLLQNNKYQDALVIFITLGAYQDAASYADQCNFGIATELLQQGTYQDALNIFIDLEQRIDCTEQIKQCRSALAIERLSTATVGNTITFGSYEQDNNSFNGTESIEWIVLAREDSQLLVVSKYALDCQPYHSIYTAVTWQTCSLRNWLNSNFMQAAFADYEQDMIPTVTVPAEGNPRFRSSPGEPTQDQIFLLSIDEIGRYLPRGSDRLCLPTSYAIAKGAWTSELNYCYWWLRSPGNTQKDASAILATKGGIHYQGNDVDNPENAIRPAMWIDLDV